MIKLIAIILLLAAFIFSLLNSPSFAINNATKLLREFKTAEALEILLDAQKSNKGKDERLNFLVIYALTKSNLYDRALEKIDTVKDFPSKNQKEIVNFLKYLSINDQNELLVRSLPKSLKINLSQDFLIDLSRQRKSSLEEINFLEASLAYIKDKQKTVRIGKKPGTRKLENYLLDRYMEASKIQRANKNYKQALDYLLRAKNLEILEESQKKDDYYLHLGISYKDLNLNTKAWDSLKYSASLGNSKAQDMIDHLKYRYIAPTVIKEGDTVGPSDYSFNSRD